MALPVLGAIFFILGAPGILNGLANMFPPFPSAVARRGYKDRPNLLPTLEEMIHLRIRDKIDDEQYKNYMMQAGYAEDFSMHMLNAARTRLSALDYITLWRRGELSDDEVNTELRQIGIDEDQLEKVKSVTLYYPNPIDIVRFAVRDAYTESTVQEYGLDEDMPEAYPIAGAKAGLSPELSKLYWRSHWELPSWTQVQEMLHRGEMNEEETANYLRVADYMPYYRQKLMNISYSPLTRVDIRRMYALNILNSQQVKRAYMDIGYNEYNAGLLTEFTIKMQDEEVTTTPKGDVTKAYTKGIISRAEASQDLAKLGYSMDAINTILDSLDEELKQEVIDLAADSIIDQYNNGALSLDQVKTQLTEMGVPSRMMALIIQRELAQAAKRAKHASKSDLDRWYKYGFISAKTYSDRMINIGYKVPDITDFLAENDVEYVHSTLKTYPYTQAMRVFIEGMITIDQLEEFIRSKYDDPMIVDTLMSLALSVSS